MRFRIDLKNSYGRPCDHINSGRFDVLVDGQRRGLNAIRDGSGYWSADIVGVPLVQGIWSEDRLLDWLRDNIDADILAPRPVTPQLEMEV